MIKNIFINPIEHRLRAGWRIFLFIIITVAYDELWELAWLLQCKIYKLLIASVNRQSWMCMTASSLVLLP